MSTADIQRLAAGAHPNLERTLFVATVAPELPPSVESFLCAALDELEALADGLEQLQSRIAALEATIIPEEPEVMLGHTALICHPGGYAVLELASPPPEVYTVSRLAPSPFPGDRRRCAILAPAALKPA